MNGIALARYCKSFEDPALDATWGTQDKPIPLLKTLLRDVRNEEECAVSSPSERCSPFSQSFDPEVLQMSADIARLDSFLKIRPKDANS